MIKDTMESCSSADSRSGDEAGHQAESRQDRTKYRLAAAMKKCMERMPVEKSHCKRDRRGMRYHETDFLQVFS